MASKYTNAFKAIITKNVKEEEAQKPTSSDGGSVRERLTKMIKAADERANESYIREVAQNRNTYERYQKRLADEENFIKNRTQDAIKADIEAAEKNDGNAPMFSGEWFRGIGEEASALVGGNIGKVADSRREQNEKVAELEKELSRRKAYDYRKITGNKDFTDLSSYNSEFSKKDSRYAHINDRPEDAGLFQYALDVALSPNSKYGSESKTMEGEELATFNYIYATEGAEKAYEYYDYITSDLYARQMSRVKENAAAIADKSKVGASALSLLTGAGKIVGTAGQIADTLAGKELDPNAPYNAFSHITNTMRETVTRDWGPAGSFAYDVGMSMADFLTSLGIRAATGSVLPAELILASSSTADTTLDALERGVPSDRAMLMGIAAGAIEIATEKFSIDTLLENFSKKGIRQFILSNITAEASEEMISEVANTIADALLAEDQSYWIQAINEYKMRGYTDSDAIGRALLDKLGDVGLAGLGGAISGGVMAGGRVAINAGANAIQNAGDAAAARDNAYRGQNTIREILNSDKYKNMRNEQKKYTVLPTAVDEEIKAARDRGEVFDIGYERPYTGAAETVEDIDLQKRIDAAETLTEKTGLRHGASEQDIADALEISRALGVEVEFFTQSSKETGTVLDGFYNSENGHVYVNVNAAKGKNAKMTVPIVVSHEITHSFEGTDEYNDLRQLVETELKKRGDSIEKAAKRLSNVYEKSGRGQTMAANEADVIANFVEKYVLGDKQRVKNVVGAKPNFGRRVLAFLNRLLAKLRRGSSAYVTVNQMAEMLDGAVTSEAHDASTAESVANAPTASEENATANETRENVENEEVITEEETPVTEAHESSQERKNAAEETSAETKKSPERESGVRSDTQTEIYDDAEEMMRRAEEAHAAGEITDEQLATVEGIYDEWYETGIRPDMSSEGFEEGKIPKALRGFFAGKRGVSWSVSDISPITDEDIKKVESHFGTTRNFEVAGYLMTDGKMLDFSGKHWGDDYSTSRTVDHRDVLEAFDYTGVHNGNNGIKAMVDMIGNGQIRLMPETGGINLAVAPNDAQIKTLAEYIRHFHGEMIVDVDEVGGDTIYTFTYNKGTAPMTVIRDIMQYFEDGTLPKAQPEYRQFLQWSISPTLEADLDAVLDHTFDAKNNEVYIGETSNFLTEVIGVDSMPVYMPASKAYAAMVPKEEWERTRYYKEQDHYHNLGKEKIIEILNASENPIAAFVATTDLDGNERNNRIVLVTDVKIDGQNAVVIEEIETTALKEGRRVKANKVITTYDRAMIADDIVNAYHENRLLHFDKKRSQNLAGVRGSKPQAAIRDTDFTNNIAQFWWNVNKGKLNVTNLQYSVSDATDKTADSTSDAYSELPTKAKVYLRKVEDRIARAFDKALDLGFAGSDGRYLTPGYRELMKTAIRPITNEYLTTGTISREIISEVFERYYKSPYGLPASMYDQAKMDARGVFENIINENWNDLNAVRRFAEQSRRAKAKLDSMAEITLEDAKKRFDTLKQMRKYERKTMRENLLTDEDMLEVGKLLRKEISIANLNPVNNNIPGIRAVYESKVQTREAEAAVAEYKRYVKAQYYAYWDGKLDTMFEWKDKSAGIKYQRETLERNIYDIVPDKTLANEIIREVINPVHTHEADSVRWKTKLKERVEALGISSKVKKGDTVSEAYAVQFYGEAIDNIRILESNPYRKAKRDKFTLEEWRAAVENMWKQSPGLDEAKIKKAAEEFRKIYEEIFNQMNDVLLANGYPPVAYRQGYFPHFTGEEETILAKFGRLMGIKTEMMALPTTINGLTENFKPGKAWFGHAQERQGFYTTYDAVTGFEQYIKGAADVIFHTEDIQKFRALANRIRYNASNDGIRAEMDKIEANEELDDAQKEAALEEIRHNGKYALSQFVAYIDEYANKLANKKSRLDRGVESLLGRKFYLVMNNLESRVAANMIAANLGSALTNFIPVNQAAAQLGWGWMLKGLQNTYKSVIDGDSIKNASTFLVNRRGYDPIVQTWLDKASNIAGKPMELIDNIASEMIVRAAYAKNLDAGMTSDEALYQADLFAASVMADRSKGAVPLIFENKNPILKLFTQFQVEVNNEFSVILKDIPRRERKKWTDAIAFVLLKYFFGAFLYNELYELIVGRRAALDPIGIAVDTAEDIANGKPWGKVVGNTIKDVGSQLPFVGGVLFEGGRIPMSSAMPEWGNLWNAVTSEGKDPKKRAEAIWKEASAPIYYWLFPFGGGMVKKAIETIDAAVKGGRYTLDNEGNAKLQYPMFMDTTAEKIFNPLRTLAFGTTSLPTAQDWIDNDYKTFGVKETAVYDELKKVGVTGRDAYDLLLNLRGAEKTDEKSLNDVKADIIRESDLSGEGKFVAYYGLLANDKEKTLMGQLNDLGADNGKVTELLMDMRNVSKDSEKRDLLLDAELSNDEKRLVYENRISADQSEAIQEFEEAGMDIDSFIKVKNYDDSLSANKELTTAERATEFARWVAKQGFTTEQQEVIQENIRKYTSNTKYDDFTDAGLDDETAYKLTEALSDLTPPEGKSQVTALQKYRAVVDTVASPVYQMDALEKVMSESEFKKTSAAYSYGIEAETYITFREKLTEYDKDGNGSLTQLEVEDALNALSGNLTWAEKMTIELTGGSAPGILYLNNDQLAVLWQLANPSWNPKNNPYDSKIGAAIKALFED